jgi:hypothetical protein
MPTGNNVSVPLSDAITEAKLALRISETTLHDRWLETLAQRALLRMNNLNSMSIINTRLEVDGGVAQLPDNVLRFIAMRYCDEEGHSYGGYITDFAFMEQCGCTLAEGAVWGDWGGVVQINDNKLMWQYPHQAPTHVNIVYRGRKLDEDGFILIYDYMVEAVKLYICKEFALSNMERYTPIQLAEWKKGWLSQSGRVVSYDAKMSWNNNFGAAVRITHPYIIAI